MSGIQSFHRLFGDRGKRRGVGGRGPAAHGPG